MKREVCLQAVIVAVAILAQRQMIFAGPPFVTDDPVPVGLYHWEVYVGSQVEQNAYGIQGTFPHVEVNFGAFSETQLHIIAPFMFVAPSERTTSLGVGDVELE